MRRLMTTVAAIALIAGAAHAQGNGKGGGQGGGQGGGGHAAAAQGGGGGGGGKDRGGAGRGQGGGGMQAVGAPREGGGSKDRGNTGRAQGGGEARGNGGQGGGNDQARGGRGGGSEARGNNDRGGGGGMQAVGAPREGGGSKDRGNVGRGGGNDNRGNAGRGNDNRGVVVDRGRGNGNRNVIVDRGRDIDVVRVANFASVPRHGLIAGCPPGLAKKNPPCIPPGQVRSPFRGYDRPDFWGLRLGDGRYWYDDGYLVRLGPDGRIGGYIPLLGGALAIGNLWPTYYQPVALPVYYESYYGLGPYNAYRYADNVIYRVDPETAAITSVAALLTGDDFVVGNPMPIGYDVYNVPYPYRAQYYDRPDAMYRYSDGYVYQIDPETRLIAAAIELLVS